MPTEEALIEAGLTRFRPVMLTAGTTTLGLVPMALGIGFDFARFKFLIGGASAQWWGPMAIAVIFGLTFATVLTLVMVPTLYSLFEQIRGWMPGRRAQVTSVAAGLILLVPLDADALTLEEAWSAAEEHSIQLQQAAEQQIQVGTLRGRALAAVQPQVDARSTYVLNQREVVLDMGAGIPSTVGGIDLDFDFGDPTIVQKKNFWQAEIGVSQRFFSGSALPAYKAARLGHQAAADDVAQTRLAVREQVAVAFYGLETARRRVDISTGTLAAAEHHQTLAQRQVDAGIASSRATTQARLDVAVARRELESANRQLVDAEEQFAALTGLRDVSLQADTTRPAPPSFEAVLADARRDRPDLAAADKRIRAARSERTGRDLRWLPVVDGRFAYLYDQNTGFDAEPLNWRATLTGSWVLWDGGMKLAESRESASRIRTAELVERETHRQIEHEIRVAWEALGLADHALAASREETTLAHQNLSLAERSFEAGDTTWLDVEQARLQQAQSELAELMARQQRELATIRLEAASGSL